VSLLAGMGASLAMGGGYVLAEELGSGADIPKSLESYEKNLKQKIADVQKAGRKTANWFVPTSKFRLSLRNAFLRAANLPMFLWLVTSFLTPVGKSIVPPPKKADPAGLKP
jgi:2-polyprenyl-6-methoxyphenol hydroxylase-like FAD-dependent oxidoreductase